MNKYIQNPSGYIVFEDGGTSPIAYGASEEWFPTYDEAIAYAMDIVKTRQRNSKIVSTAILSSFMRVTKRFCTSRIPALVGELCSIGEITDLMMSIKRGVHQSESNLS